MRAAEQRLFLKNGGVCQAVQECFKIPFREITFSIAQPN